MISIINYGLGNINAFVNVYKSLNIDIEVIENHKEIENAEKIILPGVGSFDKAIGLLESKYLLDSLKHAALVKKIPILGVCVGLQILANSSEEGEKKGLGLIDGRILKFNKPSKENFPIPHMGWNNLKLVNDNKLLKNLQKDSYFYFLHSYYFECSNSSNIISKTNYISNFCSAVNFENIYGVQFNPEKSHSNGTLLLKNFSLL